MDAAGDQVPLDNQNGTTNPNLMVPSSSAKTTISSNFRICEADVKLNPDFPSSVASPPLGVLANFNGVFVGSGLNMIFRPNSGSPTTTSFPNPVSPAPPTPPSENVLEINLTNETLSFSTPLGSIPNRGLEKQNDIFLNGVMYVQTINDVTNLHTGKANGTPTGIHFETGLWMHVPSTTDPTLAQSLVRMGSIPHGTTINAQSLSPTSTVSGPPKFPKVDITPFVIGATQQSKPVPFASQTASNTDTPRLPQDLTNFIEEGTITQAILTDPNTVLRNAIAGQEIVKTIVFTVSTNPKSPELGGGTANIAFLLGAPAPTKTTSAAPTQTGPNANAVQMSATFWIETVKYKIVVPPFKHGHRPHKISPPPPHPGARVPVFEVHPPWEITSPTSIIVESIQIQYSQQVLLNFAGLTWPHVSVATLIPFGVQTVPPSVWN